MSPATARQIREAMANHKRQPRTHGAKIRDALAHCRHAKKNPGCDTGALIPWGGRLRKSNGRETG